MPALSFPNARQAEGTLVDELTLTRILKNGEPLADSTQNAVEALIYEGIDSRIIMTREYFVKFNCDFDLLMYPFDTQVCNMQLQECHICPTMSASHFLTIFLFDKLISLFMPITVLLMIPHGLTTKG